MNTKAVVLSGPQICIPHPDDGHAMYVAVVAKIFDEDPGENGTAARSGIIRPVEVSSNGEKEFPKVGEIIDIESNPLQPNTVPKYIYRR